MCANDDDDDNSDFDEATELLYDLHAWDRQNKPAVCGLTCEMQ